MRLFLGVDGGQSSTKALIGDETGRVLGSGVGGPCNHAASGEGRARLERGLSESLAAGCRSAGLDPHGLAFEAACFGMSGGPDDKREIVARIIRAGKLIVTHDAAIALAGATRAGQGIIVIAGTGAIAYGRNAAGQSARAGGWGHIFGDEGGAFDLVRQALRASLSMEEGWGQPTALREALLQATNSADANSLLHSFYADAWPRDRVASLAPLVDAAAASGDAAASGILDGAAASLAGLVRSVGTRLWSPGEALEVAYTGGVFQSQRLAARFQQVVRPGLAATCGPPLRPAAEGALREAWRCAGLTF